MTPEEFKELQKRTGLNNHPLADWLGVSRSSVQKFRSGDTPVPGPVQRAMRLFVAAGNVLDANCNRIPSTLLEALRNEM